MLKAADAIINLFCGLVVLVAAAGWHLGDVPGSAVPIIAGFWFANVSFTVFSQRMEDPYLVEVIRAVVGGVTAPAAHLLVSGPLAPFWLGYLIMCLSSSVMLALLTRRSLWGNLLVLYYLALWALVSVMRAEANHYQLFLHAGAVALVCFLAVRLTCLLDQRLRELQERTVELHSARDALLAEVEVTHKIQTLLAPAEPALPGLTMAGRMLPAKEVGGDYYDVLELENRRFLAMGDVSGHGVTSGLTMMMARTGLVGILEANPRASLGEVYRQLNRCLRQNLRRMGVDMYMTLVLVESLGGGRFEAVGQHIPPLIYRQRTGEVEAVQLMGAWLGVVDDLPEELTPLETFQLSPGDLLVLYTDGVIERFAGKQMFGFDRLKDVIRVHGPRGPGALLRATLASLEEFSPHQNDDVTLLVAGYLGETASAPPDWEPVALAG